MPLNIVPTPLKDELIRLVRLDRNWFRWHKLGDGRYYGDCPHPTWIRRAWKTGADGFGMWAVSICLADGPKVFRPSRVQCDALAQVEVKLSLEEYAQPYPAVLVELPEQIGPFERVVCFHDQKPDVLVCLLLSHDHMNDITTTVATDGRPIEVSIQRYDEDCEEHAKDAGRVLRVALNACLALANYGTTRQWLFPKEVESDRSITKKKVGTSADGRARERLATAASLLTFSQDVVLHDTHDHGESGETTGREVRTHWRRGHWAMQPHGPGNGLRKRVLRKPVLVRSDKFLGDVADTEVTYK